MRRSDLLVAVPLLLGVDRCGEPEDTGSIESFACELGQADATGAFVPLDAASNLELQLGFQGFLIAEILARTTDDDVPDVLGGAVTLTPEGLDALGVPTLYVELTDVGDHRVTTPIQVYLDAAQLGTYVGLHARVALRLEGEGRRCVVEGDVLLIDDDPCIHTGAEPICPDDTGAP